MGRADVAADLAKRLRARATGCHRSPAALQAAELCAHRPYRSTDYLRQDLSPVELILDRVRDLERSMS